MKEFIKKLIERLEEKSKFAVSLLGGKTSSYIAGCCDTNKKTISIVNELAEEYKDKSGIIDNLKKFLKEKFNYCAEQAGMNLEAECNSEVASYFRERKELYLDRANIYGEVMREIDRLAEEHNNDFCEWHNGTSSIFKIKTKCGNSIDVNYGYEFCPYCGKKIKVV